MNRSLNHLVAVSLSSAQKLNDAGWDRQTTLAWKCYRSARGNGTWRLERHDWDKRPIDKLTLPAPMRGEFGADYSCMYDNADLMAEAWVRDHGHSTDK